MWLWLSRTAYAVHALPLVMSIGIAATLSSLPQARELYLVYILGVANPAPGMFAGHAAQLGLALTVLALLSFALYMLNRALGLVGVNHVFSDHASKLVDPALASRVRAVGLIAAALPWFGLLAGLHFALAEAVASGEKLLAAQLHFEFAAGLAVGPGDFGALHGFPVDHEQFVKKMKALGAATRWFAIGAFSPYLVVAWIAVVVAGSMASQWPNVGRLMRRIPKEPGRVMGDCGYALVVALAFASLFVPLVVTRVFPASPDGGSATADLAWVGVLTGQWSSLRSPVLGPASAGTAVALWGLHLGLLAVLFYGQLRWRGSIISTSRSSSRARIALAVALVATALLFVASLLTGFMHFKWVDMSRSIGPLAMLLVLCLASLSLVGMLCLAARETSLPVVLVLGLVALVVIMNKLELGQAQTWIVMVGLPVLVLIGLARQWATFWVVVFLVVISLVGAVHVAGVSLPALALPAGLLIGLLWWQSWPARMPVPAALLLTALGLAAAGSTYLGWANSAPERRGETPARTSGSTSAKASTRENRFDARFGEWLEARIDAREAYARVSGSKPYPVFVIAAEGGGIYAAAAIQAFLAQMQVSCPSFAQHVFAISGVSGGAVGAMVFQGALANAMTSFAIEGCSASGATVPRDFVARTAAVVTEDHLSPLAGLIVADVLGTMRDRAEGLEISLAASMQQHLLPLAVNAAARKTPWAEPFDRHFVTDRPMPALVLNATWARVGNRVVFAPFDVGNLKSFTINSFHELAKDHHWLDGDTTLAKAAVVSARFPGVVGAYEVKNAENNRWYFVDGGYVDASGALTALDIYNGLLDFREKRRKTKLDDDFDPRLILLTSSQSVDADAVTKGAQLKDLAAPVEALFAIRQLLSRIAVRETVLKLDGQTARDGDTEKDGVELRGRAQLGLTAGWNVAVVELDHDQIKLPLGWKMSHFTYDMIRQQLGHAELCDRAKAEAFARRASIQRTTATDPPPPPALEIAKTIRANSCVMFAVEELLKGRQAHDPR
jgi:hypothetical protein